MAKKEGFVLRAFEIPLQHASAEAWQVIEACWRHTTDLANWCAQYLPTLLRGTVEQHKQGEQHK